LINKVALPLVSTPSPKKNIPIVSFSDIFSLYTSAMPRHPSTHIGIAFYALNGFPVQWVIVLSSCKRFDSATVWCGTVIESVNGFVESWNECDKSPATFAPYLSFLGIVMVEKVEKQASDIRQSISKLEWKAQNPGDKYPPSDEYVRRVLLHLCTEKIISLPRRVKNNLSRHIIDRLSKLREKTLSKINVYPIIPIVEGDVFIGRTKV
jgi:hypothetical protein